MILSEPSSNLQVLLFSYPITPWAYLNEKIFEPKVGKNQKSYIFTPFQLKIHAHPHAPMIFK
jgi:hypothetical protein